eukprot:g1052.t1
MSMSLGPLDPGTPAMPDLPSPPRRLDAIDNPAVPGSRPMSKEYLEKYTKYDKYVDASPPAAAKALGRGSSSSSTAAAAAAHAETKRAGRTAAAAKSLPSTSPSRLPLPKASNTVSAAAPVRGKVKLESKNIDDERAADRGEKNDRRQRDRGRQSHGRGGHGGSRSRSKGRGRGRGRGRHRRYSSSEDDDGDDMEEGDSYDSYSSYSDEYSDGGHHRRGRHDHKGRTVRRHGWDDEDYSDDYGSDNEYKKAWDARRARAALTIQTLFRTFKLARNWRNFTKPRMIRMRQATLEVSEELLDELLEDEVIPDMLIEIFSHAGGEQDPFAPNPEEDRLAWSVWTDLVESVVAEIGKDVVSLEIRNFVNSYLHEKSEDEKQSKNPIDAVATDILDEVVAEDMRQIVGFSVQEMVSEYLFLQNFEEFLDKTMQPLVVEVALESIAENEVEAIVSNMIEGYVSETTREVVEEASAEMGKSVMQERQSKQFNLVKASAERILDTSFLRLLSRLIATNAESILMRDRMQTLAHSLIVRAVYTKLHRIRSAERMLQRSVSLRYFHQQFTAKIAMSAMMKRLSAQLDKDEDDIDAREAGDFEKVEARMASTPQMTAPPSPTRKLQKEKSGQDEASKKKKKKKRRKTKKNDEEE